MNKVNKKRLNYIVGPVIAAVFMIYIGKQVADQIATGRFTGLSAAASPKWLGAAIVLFVVNPLLEILKWSLLTAQVAPQPTRKIAASYFAGMAASMITPNRIGEYPGRLLYLGITNVYRYINVALLGTLAQLLAVVVMAAPGIVYASAQLPMQLRWMPIAADIALCCTLTAIYLGYGKIELPNFKWKPLARTIAYCRLVKGISAKTKLVVLAVSMFRFGIYSLQLVCLLHYFGIDLPPGPALGVATTFFWAMTIIPSVALAELGVRGSVALFLLSPYSHNTVGILAATLALWFMNLVIPSLIGSALLARMKIVG